MLTFHPRTLAVAALAGVVTLGMAAAPSPAPAGMVRIPAGEFSMGMADPRLGLRRNHWLPGFAYGFIESFVPTLTREAVMQVQEAA